MVKALNEMAGILTTSNQTLGESTIAVEQNADQSHSIHSFSAVVGKIDELSFKLSDSISYFKI